MYRGYRTELESDDWFTENADGTANRDTGRSGSVNFPFGTDENTFQAERYADEIYRGCGSADSRVSEANVTADRETDQTDGTDYERTFLTGWENERAVFENALYGRGQDEETFNQSILDFSDPGSSFNHLGTDTAFLVAELTDIIDSTPQVEDCTTMKQPRQKKKQQHGPVMGGM